MKQRARNIIGFVIFLTAVFSDSASAYDYSNLKFKACTTKNGYLDEAPSYKLSTTLSKYYLGTSVHDQKLKTELNLKVCENCFVTSKALLGVNIDPGVFSLQRVLSTPKAEDLRCIQYAQENFGGAYRWSNCFKSTTNIDREKGAFLKIKPCVSRAYTELTARAFLQVTDCLGIDKRELFTFLNQETGMHLNARSYSGARSIGQLTADAVANVQSMEKTAAQYSEWKTQATPKAKRKMQYYDNLPEHKGYIDQSIAFDKNIEANKGSCALVSQVNHMDLSGMKSNLGCQMEAFPRNPILPLLLSAKYYHFLKAKTKNALMNEAIKDRTPYRNLRTFLGSLKEEEKDQVFRMFAFVGYNAGPGAALNSVRTFFLKNGKDSVPKIKTLQDFFAWFHVHLKSDIPRVYGEVNDKNLKKVKDDKGDETSHYYKNAKDKLKKMDEVMKKEGDFQCFSD